MPERYKFFRPTSHCGIFFFRELKRFFDCITHETPLLQHIFCKGKVLCGKVKILSHLVTLEMHFSDAWKWNKVKLCDLDIH